MTGTARAEPASGGDAAASAQDGITVDVTLDAGRSALSGEDTRATASAKFVSAGRQGVLTVPVEAVVALRGEGGGYGLQLVQGATATVVRVETGT